MKITLYFMTFISGNVVGVVFEMLLRTDHQVAAPNGLIQNN